MNHPAIDTNTVLQQPVAGKPASHFPPQPAVAPVLVPVKSSFEKHHEDD